MGALRQAERLAAMVHADDVLATVCGNQANVMMMRAPLRAGARARRAQRHAARSPRLGTRPRRRARHARPDLRAPRRPRPRRRRAAPRARRAQPDSVPRNDRRRLRHAGADSSDSRRATTWRAIFSAAPATRTARTAGRRAAGTNGRSACSARGSRCGAAQLDEAVARADEILGAGAPPFDSLQATLIAAEALDGRGSPRGGRAAPRGRGRRRSIRGWRRPHGASISGCAASLHAKSDAAPPTRTTISRRARRCSICSANAIRPALSHLALGRLVAQNRRAIGRRATSRSRRSTTFDAARRRARCRPTRARRARCSRRSGSGEYLISPSDADDAIVRRIVDAAALPDLLGRETAVGAARGRVRRRRRRVHRPARRDTRVIAHAGCDMATARALTHGAQVIRRYRDVAPSLVEPLGRDRPTASAWRSCRPRARSGIPCCAVCG